MIYSSKDYIGVKWLQQKLVDRLYDGDISHNTMKLFIDLIAEWRLENERDAGSSSMGNPAHDNADN